MASVGYHKGEVSHLAIAVEYDPNPTEPLTIPSRSIIRWHWDATQSIQQVAERCCISFGLALRLIAAMLREDGWE